MKRVNFVSRRLIVIVAACIAVCQIVLVLSIATRQHDSVTSSLSQQQLEQLQLEQQQQDQPSLHVDVQEHRPTPLSSTGKYKYVPIPLTELTRSSESRKSTVCGGPQTFPVYDRIATRGASSNQTNRHQQPSFQRIPRIIHQTSRSRCLLQDYVDCIDKWKSSFEGWDYYLHDDIAMERLVQNASPHFANLPIIWNSCVLTGAMKADLWRLLVLWEYGGIFSDIDSCPNQLTPAAIRPDDDAVFIVDQGGKLTAFHFMAVAPRHPLLFVALQKSLYNLLIHADTGLSNPIMQTGPMAFGKAIFQFVRLRASEHSTATKKIPILIPPGLHRGIDDKYIRILNYTNNDKDYWVLREVQTSRVEKIKQYEKMNMTYFYNQINESGISCMGAIIRDTKEK